MARQPSEWDRHVRRYWALNRAAEGVMRQVIKIAWKEPETETFLRGIHAQIDQAMKAEVEAGWKIRLDDGQAAPPSAGEGQPSPAGPPAEDPLSFYAKGKGTCAGDEFGVVEVKAGSIEEAKTMLRGIGMGRWQMVPASSVPRRDGLGGSIPDTAGLVLDVGDGPKFYRSRT